MRHRWQTSNRYRSANLHRGGSYRGERARLIKRMVGLVLLVGLAYGVIDRYWQDPQPQQHYEVLQGTGVS
ncbi:hypothetical protein [Magnetococcus marinus]|uniref:hypothetical protein n=1 Tax=Magnetococcus marinus TaxID=1124597 RepID=UPI00003C5774|nr:hypothetical protein [Magnetococcus marinus]